MDDFHVSGRLARNARPRPRLSITSLAWDGLATIIAIGRSLAKLEASTSSVNRVFNGIVDLILNGPVSSPSTGHCMPP
jgi:hypothetical protein